MTTMHKFQNILRICISEYVCDFPYSKGSQFLTGLQWDYNQTWLKELAEKDIILADVCDTKESIQVLIGAYVIAKEGE